jgi:hypothetical protein
VALTAQPATEFQLTLAPVALSAAGSTTGAGALRAALAPALGVPVEAVFLAALVDKVTGAVTRFKWDDPVNTAGNVQDVGAALDGAVAAAGGRRGRRGRRALQATGAASTTSLALDVSGLDASASKGAPPLTASALLLALAPCATPCGAAAASAASAALTERVRAALAGSGAPAALAGALDALAALQGLPPGAVNASLNAATVKATTVLRTTTRWSLWGSLGARGVAAALGALALLLLAPPLAFVAWLWARRRARSARVGVEGGGAPARGAPSTWTAWADALELRIFGPVRAPKVRGREALFPPTATPPLSYSASATAEAAAWEGLEEEEEEEEEGEEGEEEGESSLETGSRSSRRPRPLGAPAGHSPLSDGASVDSAWAAPVARRAAEVRGRTLAVARRKPSPFLRNERSPYADSLVTLVARRAGAARREHAAGLNLGPLQLAPPRAAAAAAALPRSPLSPQLGSPRLRRAGEANLGSPLSQQRAPTRGSNI